MSFEATRVALLLASFLTTAVVVPLWGCGNQLGACVGTGGIVDECKEGWTRDECEDWDAQEVNDASWSWHSKSCEKLGYTVECADGSFVMSASDC
jgi:hypothetical protein